MATHSTTLKKGLGSSALKITRGIESDDRIRLCVNIVYMNCGARQMSLHLLH